MTTTRPFSHTDLFSLFLDDIMIELAQAVEVLDIAATLRELEEAIDITYDKDDQQKRHDLEMFEELVHAFGGVFRSLTYIAEDQSLKVRNGLQKAQGAAEAQG